METAGLNVIIGMGIVFVVLIFICVIIGLLKYVNKIGTKKPETVASVAAPKAVVAPAPVVEENDDSELVAVITAAIVAYESALGTNVSTDGLIVRSIKRRGFAK